MKQKKFVNKVSRFYSIAGITLLTISLIFILIPVFPYIWYIINPEATDNEITTLAVEIIPQKEEEELVIEEPTDSLPPVNTDLPNEPFIVIDKIGVYSPIKTGDDYINALRRGAWIVPDFGDPINNDKTIIVASHRFGYSSWSNEFREEVSFYNLPNTKAGDTVKIIWDQREFEYEIYLAEESNFITDYEADLILYTCKFYNSPIRIFRYAKAVN
jgi:sortase (surface protein transpeptidase)